MPVTLVATVGGATSNSYAEVSEADAYFDGRQNVSAWTRASEDQKKRALILATARIDQEEFVGTLVSPLTGTSAGTTQALRWPRQGATNEEGWDYLTTVIPEPVKKATYELALEILGGGVSLTDTGLEGFEDVKLGPLSVTPRHSRRAGSLPEQVSRYLASLLTTPSGITFRIERA